MTTRVNKTKETNIFTLRLLDWKAYDSTKPNNNRFVTAMKAAGLSEFTEIFIMAPDVGRDMG